MLLLGLPLTLVLTAVAARFVAGLDWAEAFLLGAVLSPTDPVFAAAIVGREDVPYRLRHLLNVESGLNDGLALPVVIVMLGVVGQGDVEVAGRLGDLAIGLVLGVVVPFVAIRLEESKFFSAATEYQPLNAFGIGLLVFALASVTGANAFLAAFAAGITVATMSPEVRESFHRFGELVAELLKLAALMVFGIAIEPALLADAPIGAYVFAFLALFAVRPVAIGLSLLGTRIDRREWLAAAWFGPKGFASVVYGLLVLEADVPGASELFQLAAIAIAASIVAHSSTDVMVGALASGRSRPAVGGMNRVADPGQIRRPIPGAVRPFQGSAPGGIEPPHAV